MASNPIGPGDALTGVPLSAALTRDQVQARVKLRQLYLGHKVTYQQLVAAERSGDPVTALAELTAPPPAPAPPAPPEPPRPRLRWDDKAQQYRMVDG